MAPALRVWVACAGVVAVATATRDDGNGVKAPVDCSPTAEQGADITGNTTAFSNCVANFSAPVRFCELCSPQYLAYDNAYNRLSDSCQQFGAFQAMYQSFSDLWTTSGCDKCPTASITRLQSSLTNLSDCLNHTNASDVCTSCRDALSNVTSDYANAGRLCQNTVDVIDAYRRGLELWSKHNCPTPTPGKEPVVVLLALVLTWAVLFYSASRIFTKMPARFFFGNVENVRSLGLEDTPSNAQNQYFETVGPGLLAEAKQYQSTPPVARSLADVLSERRVAEQRRRRAGSLKSIS